MIEDIRFKGNTVFKEQELLGVMKNRPGRPLLTNVLLEGDICRLDLRVEIEGLYQSPNA